MVEGGILIHFSIEWRQTSQVARALANPAYANGTNGINAEQELVAMEALVQLTRSPHEVVK